ncbi:MFS transporter [Cryptosporangium arvum]|uniref:MFS transporter n=1 Tax=Cryptosporangium arvum TaxID=80871 RepID=UPI0004B48888|nr:MFS transporter [Cryptosporangium arvum]
MTESRSTTQERRGWYFYDWAISAYNTTVITVFLGPYLTSLAERAAGCSDEGSTCVDLHPLGIPVAPGSFFAYVLSLSVIAQVLVLPLVGAYADRSWHKKRLLAWITALGATATIAMVFVTGDRYLLGGALLVVSNVLFGAAETVYYSYLPQISDPDERDAVSSRGWAIGYLGGGLLLLFNVIAVLVGDGLGWSTGEIARWSIVSAGVWWAVFAIFAIRPLRDRPPVETSRSRSVFAGFGQLARTLRELGSLKLTLLFLVAYLIYNDGIQTVITLSATYATEELELEQTALVPTILMIQFLAFGGALLLGALAKRIGAWKAILLSLVLWTFVLAAAYFVPARAPLPFVALGAAIGLVLGGSQALSRSLFSQLIPAGKEAEYYGLYQISDKGTSWMGPLLFGLAYQLTDSYRVSILSLIVFFVVGFLVLAAVPIRRAIVEAGNTPPKLL